MAAEIRILENFRKFVGLKNSSNESEARQFSYYTLYYILMIKARTNKLDFDHKQIKGYLEALSALKLSHQEEDKQILLSLKKIFIGLEANINFEKVKKSKRDPNINLTIAERIDRLANYKREKEKSLVTNLAAAPEQDIIDTIFLPFLMMTNILASYPEISDIAECNKTVYNLNSLETVSFSQLQTEFNSNFDYYQRIKYPPSQDPEVELLLSKIPFNNQGLKTLIEFEKETEESFLKSIIYKKLLFIVFNETGKISVELDQSFINSVNKNINKLNDKNIVDLDQYIINITLKIISIIDPQGEKSEHNFNDILDLNKKTIAAKKILEKFLYNAFFAAKSSPDYLEDKLNATNENQALDISEKTISQIYPFHRQINNYPIDELNQFITMLNDYDLANPYLEDCRANIIEKALSLKDYLHLAVDAVHGYTEYLLFTVGASCSNDPARKNTLLELIYNLKTIYDPSEKGVCYQYRTESSLDAMNEYKSNMLKAVEENNFLYVENRLKHIAKGKIFYHCNQDEDSIYTDAIKDITDHVLDHLAKQHHTKLDKFLQIAEKLLEEESLCSNESDQSRIEEESLDFSDYDQIIRDTEECKMDILKPELLSQAFFVLLKELTENPKNLGLANDIVKIVSIESSDDFYQNQQSFSDFLASNNISDEFDLSRQQQEDVTRFVEVMLDKFITIRPITEHNIVTFANDNEQNCFKKEETKYVPITPSQNQVISEFFLKKQYKDKPASRDIKQENGDKIDRLYQIPDAVTELLIKVQRTEHVENNPTFQTSKNTNNIICDKIINGEDQYIPVAFIVHVGDNITSGHYIAYVAENNNGKGVWYCYDDQAKPKEEITLEKIKEQIKQSVFICYRKISKEITSENIVDHSIYLPNQEDMGDVITNHGNSCWLSSALKFINSLETIAPKIKDIPIEEYKRCPISSIDCSVDSPRENRKESTTETKDEMDVDLYQTMISIKPLSLKESYQGQNHENHTHQKRSYSAMLQREEDQHEESARKYPRYQ